MPIVVRLDVMLAMRRMKSQVTLEAICVALERQPGDVLEFVPEDKTASGG